jgi:hypothetical protein
MKRLFLTRIVLTLYLGLTLNCRASSQDDHLVPMAKAAESSARYQQLWRQKLLVTSGEVARFVGLPGNSGLETAVSVYRASGKKGSLPGNYWVTATQASQRLWNCVVPGAKGRIDANMIRIVRCDAPITESTAIAVHKSWLAMLSHARPQTNSNEILVDSSREIFSAVDDRNRVLEAQLPGAPGKSTMMLINMALSLLEYCGAHSDQRASIAGNIEKQAGILVRRVAPTNLSKEKR